MEAEIKVADCKAVGFSVSAGERVSLMRIYWCEYSIPELATLPRGLARRIWLRSSQTSLRTWQFWVGVLLALLCGLSGAYLGALTGLRYGLGVGALAGIAVGLFLAIQLSLRGIRPYVRDELQRYLSIDWFHYPRSSDEVENDTSYRREMTSDTSGIAYYVKAVSKEELEARPLPEDVDDCVIAGAERTFIYVPVKDGQIVEPDAEDLIDLDFHLFPRKLGEKA